jgi:hypothetical protein
MSDPAIRNGRCTSIPAVRCAQIPVITRRRRECVQRSGSSDAPLPIDVVVGVAVLGGAVRADIVLPDLLVALASCERRRDFSRPCGARFTDLTTKIAGTNDADDPNGRMKAARDAMNKMVESQFEIRSS